jgi:predicted O-methyltransferase YrrM
MDLLEFSSQYSHTEPPLLANLRKATWQRTRHGRLMSDVHTGRVLSMVSQMLCPSVILELGTFSGYGTLCLLEGLGKSGRLHTVERNDELFELQDEFWSQSTRNGHIQRHHDMAMNVLENWDTLGSGAIDLAYVDADKQGVVEQLNALLPLMSNRGWILFDNTWWNGTLAEATGPKPDALRELNGRLQSDPGLITTILPVGDGLSAVRVIPKA